MNDETETKGPMIPPPGEGERRAQRGYVPQYDLGARVIYQALAAGRLQWVGLADRGAGTFDDIVLGLHDRIAAYQVKTSRDPEPFSIRTILLGADDLLRRILAVRRKLSDENPDTLIETIYACDDYPRTNDDVVGGEHAVSSAAFIRAHEAHRSSWGLADWWASPFAGFVTEVQKASGLDDRDFEAVWSNTRFLVGGQGRALALGDHTATDDRRLRELAALLPRLVADPSNRDHWSVADILSRLAWRDPFGLKHGHTFPVDALYQSNAPTQEALHRVLSTTISGYTSLIGPPGSGKSTLLAAGLLPTPRALVVRYLAFVPDEGQGLGRAEAFDFLHDLIKQLKQQNLGNRIMPGSELVELCEQFETLLLEASERFRNEQVRTLIVIDGLDHVPREERPQHSFLHVLPLPHAVPAGVVFILGTQRLDIEGIPPAVRDQAGQDDRCVLVTPLPREAVSRLADAAGVPHDVDHEELYARTAGHPLSTRYVIEGLLNARTPEDRQDWLQNGPAYGGDVDAFYQRAWHDLESNVEAQRALAYIALAEGPISPISLDTLVGSAATDEAWRAAGHLLVRDHRNAWSIFHNSFRLFLRSRTGLRHGIADEASVRRRYSELADMARHAEPSDPQRWMELRYRARAGDYGAVADLARPERFRAQFIEGRNPGEIRDDIDFGFEAAGALSRTELVVNLILAKHEVNMRADAFGDDVFETLVELGDLYAALGLLGAEGISLSVGKGYELVDAFLEAGDVAEARKLFHILEPIDKLLGSKALDLYVEDNDLIEWAERVLVFREPNQVLAALGRLRAPDDPINRRLDIEAYRTHLKLVAARGQLKRNPDLAPEMLTDALQIAPEHRILVLRFAAEAAFQADDDDLAIERLESALPLVGDLGPESRREAATIAAQSGRLDLAASFFKGIAPPTLANWDFAYDAEDLGRASHQIVIHASLAAWLGCSFEPGASPDSYLLAIYQSRLETLGRLLGEGRGGYSPSVEPIQEFRAALDFLQHAEGDSAHDSERWRLDQVMDGAVTTMVDAASALGQNTFERFTQMMDARLVGDPGRLGRSTVRRAYAMAAFRREYDPGRAELRLAYKPGIESTPADQLAEAARAASAFATFGLEERARSLLSEMHQDGLGFSRPPKKDPQYILWQDLFARACEEDPTGRTDRLRFLGRFLTGMAETEGNEAGRRLVVGFLDQAAQAGSAWAQTAADRVEEIGLATWPELVSGLLIGAVKRRPDLTAAAAVLFGRITLLCGTEYNGSIYPQLIELAPADQLERVVRHAVTCVETDGHPAKRITFLEDIVEAAGDRSFNYGTEALARWRAELPPPKSGSSPEDPFFLVRTLEEMTVVLERIGDDRTWGAVQAFERIAPRSDYEGAKTLFESTPELRDDERSIEAIAKAALATGRREDATHYLAQLKQCAESKGSWGGGWHGDAKQRYHRINVLLGGDAARRAAFDALVDDLAHRREYVGYLLADLCEVLELLSPRPTWAEVWAVLQEHMSQFREYRLGRELGLLPDVPDGDEHTLADVLFRAIDTTAIELTRAGRATALELTQIPGGPEVVAALLPRLWRAGGQHALEAAQIAWECRDNSPVRDAMVPHLAEMADSDDFAVRRTAMFLGRAWGLQTKIKREELPVLYQLKLPQNPQASRFEPPSGTSPVSSGLWTEDGYAWTWPLERALKFTVDATGLELTNLRARTSQLMARMGGSDAFGPEAIARQQSRLHRLSLHATYTKLGPSAAFAAMREVVGELIAADAIDARGVPFILRESGTFATNVSTLPPSPRPRGVPRVAMADIYRSGDIAAWRSNAAQDAVRPVVAGYLVLASTAVHERRHFRQSWIVEQYSGPDVGCAADSLWQQLRLLPRVVIADGVDPLYGDLADGAVAHPEPDIAGSVAPHMVMLCPRVAAHLGWHPDPRQVFTYFDSDGHLVVQTLYWRDGGILSSVTDSGVVSHGYILLVRNDRAEELRPFLASAQLSRAWRATQTTGEDDRLVVSGE